MQLSLSAPNSHCDHPSVSFKVKRLVDIAGATVGLCILAVLFIPLAVAIKIDSQGPIFYSQIRCSLNGTHFRIWKFRSMVSNAEALRSEIDNEASGHIFKNKNAPRVTRIGQFLRRFSLDEPPQFRNVLKGEMSLVGTRPSTSDEVENYSPFHRKRTFAKPVTTGEWQVKGRSNIESFDVVASMELRYQSK
ncbi:MAG: sugar transferase [Cyanobacteria bacterium J06581_3]